MAFMAILGKNSLKTTAIVAAVDHAPSLPRAFRQPTKTVHPANSAGADFFKRS
jgi:hypothetical protein